MTHPLKISKLVLWPRPDTIHGKPVMKYVVMGMIVTDEPLVNVPIESSQQLLAGGPVATSLITEALEAMKSGDPILHGSPALGDASNVLVSLTDIVFAENEEF